MDNIGYYIFLLVAVIVAFLIVKKVASCLIRSIVLIVLAAVIGYIYWMSGSLFCKDLFKTLAELLRVGNEFTQFVETPFVRRVGQP